MNLFLRLFIVCLLVFSLNPNGFAQEKEDYFASLKKRLVEDGFDEKWIQTIYSRREVEFEARIISRYFIHSEATLDYDQFATEDSIYRARKYMEKYKKDLGKAEKEYGVDKELITAIILVETRFGAYTGRTPILNTLSTMSSLADLWVRGQFWEMDEFPEEERPERREFEKMAYKKANWAYDELKAFLAYVWYEGLHPVKIVKIKGSMAGAMGLAQFMPTNIPLYAKDGNGDGRIDLFQHSDSIASVANFLKNFGWKPGISMRQAKKVIYYYNHSDYYVDAVIEVFKILKG
jgi:membrane-bound lytic murein transglycosylase B